MITMRKLKRKLTMAAVLVFVIYKACCAPQNGYNGAEELLPNIFLSGSENFLSAPSGAIEGTVPENALVEEYKIPDKVIYGEKVELSAIPSYTGIPYAEINGNVPCFAEEEKVPVSFEYYDELDEYGRCTGTYACIGTDLMPEEERGAIGMVKPTGWHTVKYDCIEDLYLYNRCHLIGFQLTGENANERNLLTGTRYMNVKGMLPFENMVADYVRSTGNHVLYRVTPIFEKENLLAHGVQMEAFSVEDNGKGICFNVFCYNVQDGVLIDYTDGSSSAIEKEEEEKRGEVSEGLEYILNTNSKKFHYPSCSSLEDMSEHNKQEYVGTKEDLLKKGYSPCGRCTP